MRNAFIQELVQAASVNEKIALVVGDLGYGVVEPFVKRFPKRFFNAGVAEQNMMGLSAGLASEGFHVFVYSIANFPTFRCAEQIRNDIDYHNLPVTIVAVGGGLAYGNLGYSHHAIQDYVLMRSMPNMLIAAPGDPMEVRACMHHILLNRGPSYLRLGKAGEKNIHEEVPVFKPGSWVPIIVCEGSNKVVLSTGTVLKTAHQALLADKNNKFSLYSVPIWGRRFKHSQCSFIRNSEVIVTFEDGLLEGGFGSWMLEIAAANNLEPNKIRPIALDANICGLVGAESTLHHIGGIDGESFLKFVRLID